MKKRFVALAALLAVAVGFVAWRSIESGPQASADDWPEIAEVMVLDAPYDALRLAPPPEGAQPLLSPTQALDVYRTVNTELNLPSGVESFLGSYTAEVGDGTYRFRDRLVWGYTWQQCAQPRHLPDPHAQTPCTRWLFLDANTGQMLEAVYQQEGT